MGGRLCSSGKFMQCLFQPLPEVGRSFQDNRGQGAHTLHSFNMFHALASVLICFNTTSSSVMW